MILSIQDVKLSKAKIVRITQEYKGKEPMRSTRSGHFVFELKVERPAHLVTQTTSEDHCYVDTEELLELVNAGIASIGGKPNK